MNKSDIKLCIVILVLAIISYGIIHFTSSKSNNKKAVVYYDNNEVLSIDLSNLETKQYTVKGFNGEIQIESSDGKVRVVDEISPKHICSKQGWIKESYESIICLPNKVVIDIEDNDELDTIVR